MLLIGVVLSVRFRAQAERPPAPPRASRLASDGAARTAEWPIEAVHQVSARLTSGALPTTREQFEFLKDQGIDTIVSVDGAPPDVELAQEIGLRYIHIPLRYSGVDPMAQAALTRVMRDVPGKIFVHCHHGRHRGPAAAAICAMVDGALTREQARQLLEDAGTSPHYTGLWRDVAAFEPPPADAKLPDLVSVAPVDPLASVMVRIDGITENINDALPNSDGERAELERLAAQALLLQEEFAEAARLQSPADGEREGRHAAMLRELKQGSELAASLHSVLASEDVESARDLWAVLKGQCRDCHRRHRDQ